MKLIFQKILLLSFVIFLFFSQSCRKDEVSMSGTDSLKAINKYVISVMKNWYLWYDKIRSDTPNIYLEPQEFLDSLVYKQVDKWSFIITKKEYDDYFVKGNMYGHGFAYRLDAENRYRIVYVYKNSDLYPNGVRRGWIIEKINGITPDTSNFSDLIGPGKIGIKNTFTFKKPDSSEVILTSTKKQVTENQVLYSDTFHVDNIIAGYLVFDAFIADAKSELNQAFDSLKKVNINELILDLRYNGGGDVTIASYLAGIIAGNIANGQPLINYYYNDKHTAKNSTWGIEKNSESINLSRVFVITTKGTASASELLINGLKPYMTVKLIGSQTYGKPVGMDGFLVRGLDYYLFPITFRSTNKDNYGDYYDGLPVDKQEIDDIYHDFGDRNEACVQQALYYIKNGTFGPSAKAFYSPYIHHKKRWELETDVY